MDTPESPPQQNGGSSSSGWGVLRVEVPSAVPTSPDERGVVYVEFLIAFFPLFLMFLAVCQLALIAAGEAVVRHAAFSAVRSAIVVLEDSPKNFGDVERGSLSQGNPKRIKNLDDVASSLGIGDSRANLLARFQAGLRSMTTLQHGARMEPIRTAALLPLIPLAPSQALRLAQQESLSRALASPSDQLPFALSYTKTATLVTVHDTPGTDALALEPLAYNASVTVKVRYLFHCSVPLVRNLMCRSPVTLFFGNLGGDMLGGVLSDLVSPDARFSLLTASATLPNQGAKYYPREK